MVKRKRLWMVSGLVVMFVQATFGIQSKMTPLKRAAYEGDLAKVRQLVQSGSDPNGELEHGFSPLHWATSYNHKEVVEFLIGEGADIHAMRFEPHVVAVGTPLHLGAAGGGEEVVRLLIDAGARVNDVCCDMLSIGRTALHEASVKGHISVVKILIEAGANVTIIDRKGKQPLHLAANIDIAGGLIAAGADVNAKDDNGRSTLDYTVEWRRLRLAKFLVAKGAEETPYYAALAGDTDKLKSFIGQGWDVNAKNFRGESALHFAADSNVCELLIAHGGDINAKRGKGDTPLHRAAQWGRKDVAEILLSHGADMYAESRSSMKPVDFAAWKGKKELVELFVDRGLDLKSAGPSALFRASSRGHDGIVRYLIGKGVNPNAKNKSVYLPLHTAASMGQEKVVQVLISAGAHVNARTSDGATTALHLAMRRGKTDIIELLISNGADVNAKTGELGSTPLHEAVRTGQMEVVKMLLVANSDISIKNSKGETALNIAERYKQDAIAEVLRKHAIGNIRVMGTEGLGSTEGDVAEDRRIELEAARVAATRAMLKMLHQKVIEFKMDTGKYPHLENGLLALVEQPSDVKNYRDGGYLDGNEVPKDAWGHYFVYVRYPERGGEFMVVSYGADGKPGGEGFDADLP